MESLFKILYGWLNCRSQPLFARILPKIISPNSITYFRTILVVPILALLFLDLKVPAIVLFVFSGLLDYVDGALARGRNLESDWGKFIDPIADKIFYVLIVLPVSIVQLCLYEPNLPAMIFLAVVIWSVILETMLAAIRTENYQANKSLTGYPIELKADYSGKIKFNLELWGAGFMMLAYPDSSSPALLVALGLIVLSLPFAFISYLHKDKKSMDI